MSGILCFFLVSSNKDTMNKYKSGVNEKRQQADAKVKPDLKTTGTSFYYYY